MRIGIGRESRVLEFDRANHRTIESRGLVQTLPENWQDRSPVYADSEFKLVRSEVLYPFWFGIKREGAYIFVVFQVRHLVHTKTGFPALSGPWRLNWRAD